MIQFIIGDPLSPPPAKINQYELVVTVMHGDADKYEDLTVRGPHDRVMSYLISLNAFFNLSWNAGCDLDEIKKAVKAANPEDPIGAWDRYSDFVGRDITCEDYLAAPDSIKLFWYDSLGVKYKVKIEGMKTSRH